MSTAISPARCPLPAAVRFGAWLTLALVVSPVLTSPSVAQPGGMPPAPVGVATVELRENVQPRRNISGQLFSSQRAVVASEESGRVMDIAPPDPGTAVKRGEPLARMDDTLLQAERARAVAGLERQKAALVQSQAARDVAEATLKQTAETVNEFQAELDETEYELTRLSELYKQGSATEREYRLAAYRQRASKSRVEQARLAVQQAQSELAAARTAIALANAQIAEAEADLQRIDDRLAKMVVQAPFDGVIVEQNTELGQWLSPGSPVATMVAIDPIDAVINVPESMIGQLPSKIADASEQKPTPILIDALEQRFDAALYRVVPAADRQSRTYPVYFRLANPDGLLKVGMTVQAELPTRGVYENALVVPRDAITPQATGDVVFVVREGKAMIAPVRVAFGLGDDVVIEPRNPRSLQAGDTVVIEGNEKLFPGQSVNPTAGSPATNDAGGNASRAQNPSN